MSKMTKNAQNSHRILHFIDFSVHLGHFYINAVLLIQISKMHSANPTLLYYKTNLFERFNRSNIPNIRETFISGCYRIIFTLGCHISLYLYFL
jgi:hypothetical protein